MMCKVIGVGSTSYYSWKNDSKPVGGSKVGLLEEKIKTHSALENPTIEQFNNKKQNLKKTA